MHMQAPAPLKENPGPISPRGSADALARSPVRTNARKDDRTMCLDPNLGCQLTILARDVLVPRGGLLLRRRRRLALTQCTCPLGVHIAMWAPETGLPRTEPLGLRVRSRSTP